MRASPSAACDLDDAKKSPNPIDKHVGNRMRMRQIMLDMSHASYLRPSSAAFITNIAESDFRYTQVRMFVRINTRQGHA